MAIEDLLTKQDLKNFILQVLAEQPKQATIKLKVTGSGLIAFGTSSATWTAAAVSAAVTVPHGLGVTPAAIFVGLREAYNNIPSFYDITSKDATNFVYEGRTTNLANSTGTQNTYWLAIA